jgi:uncharacterized OB-fold protein
VSAELVLPTLDDVNRPFWDGCRDGVLKLQRCTSCGHLRYPIAAVCPRCMKSGVAWEQLSGRGTVFSFVVFHHAYNDAWRDRIPYNVALVELEEGPTVLSNVVGVDPEDLRIGLPVAAVFEPMTDELSVLRFEAG